MKEESIQLIFKPRARLLLQLGHQLIRNENIALLELVKNAYDADARTVNVYMDKIDDSDNGTIIIEDDGFGMDKDIIKDVWMEPGSSHKLDQIKDNKPSPKYNRLPIGEKGIGRFGVHKLGNIIELVSKKEGSNEVYLEIDWRIFQNFKYLDDVHIKMFERNIPKIFKGKNTGTSITIRGLHNSWTRGMLRNVYRALISLTSPFDKNDSFKVNFYTDKPGWLEGLLDWKDIKHSALFNFKVEIEDNSIQKFEYNFTPWPSMSKIDGRQVTEKDDIVSKMKLLTIPDGSNKKFNLKRCKIGKIKFQGFIFSLDTTVLKLGLQDKQGLKEYLSSNGGVRIYRDGLRIYDYGEPGNDWLDLDIRRVNQPGKSLSNNILMASIDLDRKISSDLIEKTNREGFLENEAYQLFRDAIIYTIGIIENLRFLDRDKLNNIYRVTKKAEPVLHTLGELKLIVDKKIKDEPLKREINGYLIKIENDYNFINETLLKSAGAGLSLSVVIHEVEKIILEVEKVLRKENASERLTNLVKHLSSLIDGYADIIKKSTRTNEDIKKVIDQALFNIEYRLSSHKISVLKEYRNFKGSSKTKVAKSLLLGTLMNVIDNSIHWLDFSDRKNKKLYINLSDQEKGFLSLIIADNGTGFVLPTDEITKPFVSAKPGGMGLGLHIANEVMEAQGGRINFPEYLDFGIPDDFKDGAVVVLNFKI